MKLLEEVWSDPSVPQDDSSLIAGKASSIAINGDECLLLGNTLKALSWNSDSERNFTERLLVSLGFVKVRTDEKFIRV